MISVVPRIVYYGDNLPAAARLDPMDQPRQPLPPQVQKVVNYVQKHEPSNVFNQLNRKVVFQFGEQSGVEISARELFPLSDVQQSTFQVVNYFDLQLKYTFENNCLFKLYSSANKLVNQIELQQGELSSVWFADDEYFFIQQQQDSVALLTHFVNNVSTTYRIQMSKKLQKSCCDGCNFVLIDENCLIVSGEVEQLQ